MKKIITMIILLWITILSAAVSKENIFIQSDRFLLMYDIPAMRSIDNATYFVFPLISTDLNFTNSILDFKDLNIFTENHFITDNEKKLLTKNNLKIYLSYKTPIFKIGYKTMGLDISYIMGMRLNLLDKQFSKLILYGNDRQDYVLHNGVNSFSYGFTKTKISYSYPNSFKLNFIPTLHTKYNFLNNSIDFIKNTSIYVGGNLNFYLPIVYGEVLKSEQCFGTNVQETYANYKLDVIYTDVTQNKYKRKFTAGFGLSMVADFNKGKLFVDVDDILGGINFKNLSEKIFKGTFQDSLTHFENNYQAINNDTIIDETKNRYKSFSGNFTIGMEYNVYKNIFATLTYKNSKYQYPNGISLQVRKTIYGFLPIAAKIGYDKMLNYQLNTGLYLHNLEFYFHITTYGGFFNYANGTGLGLNWIQRF